jgi:ribosomal protein S18 acetylase RimI-like enzyme
MTAQEFAVFRERAVAGYAEQQVRAGEWPAGRAEQLAAEQTDSLLAKGVETPNVLLVSAETQEGVVVGRAWLALAETVREGAWLYDIEIEPSHRGRGYGRALLAALEELALSHGASEIGLNVFAENSAARGLYESSGYEATSLHMRKRLARERGGG